MLLPPSCCFLTAQFLFVKIKVLSGEVVCFRDSVSWIDFALVFLFCFVFQLRPPPPPPPFLWNQKAYKHAVLHLFSFRHFLKFVYSWYMDHRVMANQPHPPTYPPPCMYQSEKNTPEGLRSCAFLVGCRSPQDFRSRPQASAGYSLSSLENKSVYLCAGCCGTATAHLQEFVPWFCSIHD